MLDKEAFQALTGKKIEELLQGEVPIEYILWAQEDTRVSVQNMANRYMQRQRRALLERERVEKLYRYESIFYDQGLLHVAGVDEVGRGPIAGPVTVAAVILPPGLFLEGIKDSKQLSETKREALYDEIMEQAIAVSCVSYSPAVIDELNIYQATKKAMLEAVATLSVPAEAVLVDAMPLKELSVPHESLVKGDAKSASIAAASIIAKVTRDRYMKALDAEYPGYGFADHKGYGTEMHRVALENQGITEHHRKSFEPVASLWRALQGEDF